MLLYYHGQLSWVTKSCGLRYSQREIRNGGQMRCWRPSQMSSSGHLRRCSDADMTEMSLRREKDASILSWPTIMGH
eukprot:scaffold312_cov89-Skeletonema_dohrnii-CCMP3373.AAC.1